MFRSVRCQGIFYFPLGNQRKCIERCRVIKGCKGMKSHSNKSWQIEEDLQICLGPLCKAMFTSKIVEKYIIYLLQIKESGFLRVFSLLLVFWSKATGSEKTLFLFYATYTDCSLTLFIEWMAKYTDWQIYKSSKKCYVNKSVTNLRWKISHLTSHTDLTSDTPWHPFGMFGSVRCQVCVRCLTILRFVSQC